MLAWRPPDRSCNTIPDMKSHLFLAPFLAVAPLTAQSQPQNQFTGVENFLTFQHLDGSGIHFKMNRVSNAGDINNDGIDDYLVGIPGAEMNAGAAYVYSGRLLPKGPPTPVELFSLQGNPGDTLGTGVCTLGDIDGDGCADFAVGASGGQYVQIYSGKEGTLLATIQEDIDTAGADYAKSMVAVDLDGDGTVELAVADPSVSFDGGGHTGFVEIFRLESQSDGTLTVTSLTRMEGIGREWFGADLDRVGSGASADYLLVGSPRMEGSMTEVAHGGTFHLLRDDPFTAEFDLQSILVVEDTHVQTTPGQFGISVASIGDIVGGDGVEEFVVGAPAVNSGADSAGVANVYDVDGNLLMSIDGSIAFEGLGYDVAGLGDADGDRIPDFLVSAPGLGEGGPGNVYLFSGADGTLVHTLAGTDTTNHYGMQIATASDIDGDGSRDFLVSEFDITWQQSLVYVMRPLHSLPYRISVDASPTALDFAAVHGLNHGPLHKGVWSKRLDAESDIFYFTNFDADFSDRYEDLKIPQARITGEGIGDMNYLWNIQGSDPDSYARDFDGPLSAMADINNYNFLQMDTRMDAAEAIPGMDTIWRIGHDKGVHPETGEWMAGFHEGPNNLIGFSEVVTGILRHYNEGWGRDVPAEKMKYVELWNEPSLESWTGTAQEFADLQISIRETLDREFDADGDGVADDLIMLTPVAPSYFGNFTVDFLDALQLNYDPQNPQRTKLEAVVDHIYDTDPTEFLSRLENFDLLYEDIEATKDIFKTGPNQETELPEVWLTEWNRDLNDYAKSGAAMPFILNTFFYMNQVCAGEVIRSDGKPLRVRLGGAQFFGANDIWYYGIDPETGLEGSVNRHVGLAWEVYGKTLYQEASNRLEVSGTFHEDRVHPDATNAVKDFTVMAGRSETEELVVLVVSSMRLAEPGDTPIDTDYQQRHPYVVDVDDLGFVPLTIERFVQEGSFQAEQSANGTNLIAVPESGSLEPAYQAWSTSLASDSLTIQVDDMVENSYEVIYIRGQESSGPETGGPDGPGGNADAPSSDGPGVNQLPDTPPGSVTVGRDQVTRIGSAGNGTGGVQSALGGNGLSKKAKAKSFAKKNKKGQGAAKKKAKRNKSKAKKGARKGAKTKANRTGRTQDKVKKGAKKKAKRGGKGTAKRGKARISKKLGRKRLRRG